MHKSSRSQYCHEQACARMAEGNRQMNHILQIAGITLLWPLKFDIFLELPYQIECALRMTDDICLIEPHLGVWNCFACRNRYFFSFGVTLLATLCFVSVLLLSRTSGLVLLIFVSKSTECWPASQFTCYWISSAMKLSSFNRPFAKCFLCRCLNDVWLRIT